MKFKNNKNEINELQNSVRILSFNLSENESKIKLQDFRIKQLISKWNVLEFENKSLEITNRKLCDNYIDSEILESIAYKLNDILETPIEYIQVNSTDLNSTFAKYLSLKKLIWINSTKSQKISKWDQQFNLMIADVIWQAISLMELIQNKLIEKEMRSYCI